MRGHHAVVQSFGSEGGRLLRVDLASDREEEIGPEDWRPGTGSLRLVTDLSAAGDVLFATGDPLVSDSPRDVWRWRGDGVELVTHIASVYDAHAEPFAFNDAGNYVLDSPGSAAGGREQLSLSGAAPTALCPGQAAATADQGGCQIASAPTATAWPLLAPLLLLGAARRRRAAGLEARATGSTF